RAERVAVAAKVDAIDAERTAKEKAEEARVKAEEARLQKAEADQARDDQKTQAKKYADDLSDLKTKIKNARSVADFDAIQREVTGRGLPPKGIGEGVPPPP